MKYIEIAENVSVRIDEIEAITQGEDYLTSLVKTHHNTYLSTFPYDVLIELLEREQGTDEEKKQTEIQQRQLNILKELGTFAG